MAKDNRTVKSP